MCKSKAEGGARCASYIRKNYAKRLEAKVAAEEAVRYLRKEAKSKRDDATKERLASAELVLVTEIAKLDVAEALKLELDLRPKEKQRGKGKGLTKFIGSCFKPDEWELLDHRAKERGITRSALVRELLDGLPTFNPVLAGVSPWQKWEGERSPFRQATQGRKGNYTRESRGIRVSETTLKRLEREAGLFGLTTSDYVRAVVLGKDPRTFGHHVSAEYATEQLAAIQRVEEAENVEPQNVQAFWQERIRAERNLLAAA